jgi:hypothetical protein
MSVIQSGGRFSFEDVTNTYEQLPAGNYILKYDPRAGYYLNKKEDFELPKKVYGDHSIVQRWLKSWEVNSAKNMGIILSGVKGSGKTITAQKFCVESNLPVVIINENFHGSDFIDFITSPKLGECIIFIDEFEKIYSNRDTQYDMLSLMDGNYSTSLIFLLTVNEERLNDYLVNRLNRIKYRKAYGDLEFGIMDEVIDDMLINKDHKQSIFDFFDKVNMRTFDLLTNLIKEMNLFNEDAIQCGMHLNLKPERKTYQVFEIFEGAEYECYTTEWTPGDDEYEFHRKSLDYLPSIEDARTKQQAQEDREFDSIHEQLTGEAPSKSKNRWYTWEVHFDAVDCEVERHGKMINVFHPESGLRIRLKEDTSRISLVF